MTTGHIPGEVLGQGGGETQPGTADDAQNVPGAPGAAGAPSEQKVDYLQNAGSKDDASSPALEGPRRHEARLKRRRRLLAIGGVPVALAATISLWLGSIFLISLVGNRAAAAGHYNTALLRYRTAARINPWLEQWHIHFNLGTGQLAARDPTSAATTLNQVLSETPKAKADPETKVKEVGPPECMVRINLYAVHPTLAVQARGDESSAAVTEYIKATKKAADVCKVPLPPEQNPSPSSTLSTTPSSDPSSNPSSQSSSDPSLIPLVAPSNDLSSSVSPQLGSNPSPGPLSSSSPGETPSNIPSAEPTLTSVDGRAERPQDRSNGSPGATKKSGGSGGGGKPW